MFEITKPSSTPSTFSSSLTATKPPKADSGVIRGRPTTLALSYELALDISNEGNDKWVTHVEITVNSLTPEVGPEIELTTKDAFIEDLGPNATQEVTFPIQLVNPENPPTSGDRYRVIGTIKFHQDDLEGQQVHPIDLSVDVQISE